MIRDPSDGSMRTAEGINPTANEINTIVAKTRSKEITSGLPFTKAKAEYLARLEWSRGWLKNYFEKVQP
jgi:hypothetical protein